MITMGRLHNLFFFSSLFRRRLFSMRLLVPFIEHGRHSAFPVPAPGTMHVTTVMPRAEEDHLHEAKEEEQEENGTADAKRKESEVMKAIHVRIKSWTIAVPILIHHQRDGCSLSIFSGL